MALSTKTNQLTGPAVTGNSATTDPGFQPKALFMWSGLQTTTGATADAQWTLGVTSSTTTETAAGYNADDNVASSDASRYFNTARLLVSLTAGTATANNIADLTSFDATGFTTNWPTLTTASPLYNYLVLGGTDITNVKSGNFAAATSGATQAVTGVGFQPDIVFLFATLQTTSAMSNNNNQYGFGVMHSSGQWAMCQRDQNAQATMNTTRAFSNARAIMIQTSTTNALFDERSFVSMDSDGFTLNIDTQGGTGFLIGYMAVKGGQWKVGNDTQKTSTGTKAITGAGFTPVGAVFGSVCDTQTSGTADNARLMFGATTGTSNNVALWTGDTDNVPDAIANTIMSNNKCIVMATEGASASPTTNADAALSSFDSDGLTLNWTTADATARVFGYVMFGSNATPPASFTPTYIPYLPPFMS